MYRFILLSALTIAVTLGNVDILCAQHVFTVNSLGDLDDSDLTDGVASTGQTLPSGVDEVTLRAAIAQANEQWRLFPFEDVRIEFNISGAAPFVIRPQSKLPEMYRTEVVIDGSTQPGFVAEPVIEVDGQDLTLPSDCGLSLQRGEVHSLSFYNFPGNGIETDRGFLTRVRRCYIGINANLDAGIGNAKNGIEFKNSVQQCRVERCVIGLNGQDGVRVDFPARSANTPSLNFSHNIIGTDSTNTANVGNGGCGINVVGGAERLICQSNVICNNADDGFRAAQESSTARPLDLRLRDNFIGVDGQGMAKWPNGGHGANLVDVGGAEVYRNTIGGNLQSGIALSGDNISRIFVYENVIGSYYDSDLETLLDLGNAQHGVLVDDAHTTNAFFAETAIIGATTIASGSTFTDVFGNSVCGNGGDGICVLGGSVASVQINDNQIGYVGTPNKLAGNLGDGIYFDSDVDGASVVENLICNSGKSGLRIRGDRNVVESNLIGIGINRLGNFVIQGNRLYGVYLLGEHNDIGGSNDSLGNFITGNRQGIVISTLSGRQNLLDHNFIGVDNFGSIMTQGQKNGVLITNGASQNRVLSSVIQGQTRSGVAIRGNETKDNSVFRSNVAQNIVSDIDLGTIGMDSNDVGDADDGANSLQNSPEMLVAVDDPVSGDLEVMCFVDSDPAHAAYPIWVEIYFDDGYDKQYMRRLVFTEADFAAGGASTTIPNGVSRLGSRSIIATATDANRNTSEFSLEY